MLTVLVRPWAENWFWSMVRQFFLGDFEFTSYFMASRSNVSNVNHSKPPVEDLQRVQHMGVICSPGFSFQQVRKLVFYCFASFLGLRAIGPYEAMSLT